MRNRTAALVALCADDAVAVDDDRSNRDFSLLKRLPRQIECRTHPARVRLQQVIRMVNHKAAPSNKSL